MITTTEQIPGHLCHRYLEIVNQIMVATVKLEQQSPVDILFLTVNYSCVYYLVTCRKIVILIYIKDEKYRYLVLNQFL